MRPFTSTRRLLFTLGSLLLSFGMFVNTAWAQAGVEAAEDTGKSYAMAYGAVVIMLAVALILVCKSSGRHKDPPLHIEEDS